MKKIRFLLITVALIVSALSAKAEEIGGIDYSFNDTQMTATVWGTTLPSGSDVVIPESVEYMGGKYSVKYISGSFSGEWNSITVPGSVVNINVESFNETCSVNKFTFEYGEEPLTASGGGWDYGGSNPAGIIPLARIKELYLYRSIEWKVLLNFNTSGTIREPNPSFEKVVIGADLSNNDTLGRPSFPVTTLEILGSTKYVGAKPFTDYTTLILHEGIERIGNYAFTGAQVDVKLPSTLKEIGLGAFNNNKKLTEITIPATMKEFSGASFSDCTNLRTLTFEASSEPIEVYSIVYGDKVNIEIETLNIDRNIDYYKNGSFEGCRSLTVVNLGKHVTYLHEGMFNGCTALRSITIPSSVNTIGEEAFAGCTSLKLVNIEDGTNPITIETSATANGSANTFYSGALETVYLGRNVKYKKSGLSPFMGMENLATLTIGNKVTEISDYLFYGCTDIASFAIPSSVKRVGDYAFFDCKNSRSLMLSSSVESIGDYAFYNCEKLARITIPKSVVSIGEYAFRNCSAATTISLGNSLQTIGDYAFLDCFGATTISFGNSLKQIGNNAFYNCSAVKSIELPSSLEKIGANAFALCAAAESVDTGDGMTEMGMSAFADCEALTTVTLGASLQQIGDFAFYNCESIKNVNVKSPVPPVAYETAFTDYSATLTVPVGKTAVYKAADDYCWPLFASFAEKDFPISGGVEGVEVSGADAPATYYNLNGLPVDPATAAPGLYIKKQGGNTSKVIVK